MICYFFWDDDLIFVEQVEIFDFVFELKKDWWVDKSFVGLQMVVVIFDKFFMCICVLFVVGIVDFGGLLLIILIVSSQFGGKEILLDMVRVLECQVVVIVWCMYVQLGFEEMVVGICVFVINVLFDDFYLCQLFVDLLMICEYKGDLKGFILIFFGDGQSNMVYFYVFVGVIVGMYVCIVFLEDYVFCVDVIEVVDCCVVEIGGLIVLYIDLVEVVVGVDVVVIDIWVLMGKEEEKIVCICDFGGYKVILEMMILVDFEVIFIYCFFVDCGYEVDFSVIDGLQSVVWDEVENWLYVQKVLLVWFFGKKDV